MDSRMGRVVIAVMLATLVLPAAAQAPRDAPRQRGETPATPPGRSGFGADNDAQQGGVVGNAPFNNQLRKHTDPLCSNCCR